MATSSQRTRNGVSLRKWSRQPTRSGPAKRLRPDTILAESRGAVMVAPPLFLRFSRRWTGQVRRIEAYLAGFDRRLSPSRHFAAQFGRYRRITDLWPAGRPVDL